MDALEKPLISSQVVNNGGGNNTYNIELSFDLPNITTPEQFMNWFIKNDKAVKAMQDTIIAPINGKSYMKRYRNTF